VTTHVHKGFGIVKQTTPGKSVCRLMVNIDCHMDLVPEVLMNWGMKNIGGAIMGFIKKAAEELPESH
jgi:hypothetical protein